MVTVGYCFRRKSAGRDLGQHNSDGDKSPELILSERSGRYAPDQKLADDKLALLRHLIEEFQQRGTKVVLMLLPIINPVVETMEKTGRYQFIWDLQASRQAWHRIPRFF